MKICSVIPQIANRTGYVDSKLFTQITNSLKGIEDKSQARDKAKQMYEFIHSNEFMTMFGDWKLYQRYKLGTMTELDIVKFKSKYNGDITLLEQSIPTDRLNDLFEPIYNFTDNTPSNVARGISRYITVSSESNLSSIATKLNISLDQLKDYLKAINTTVNFRDTETSTAPVLNSELILSKFVDYDNIQAVKIVDLVINANRKAFKDLLENPRYSHYNSESRKRQIANFINSELSKLESKILNKIDKENVARRDEITRAFKDLKADISFINETTGKRSIKFRAILSHLNSNYGIKLQDKLQVPSIEDEEAAAEFESTETYHATWADGKKMMVNYKKNVAQTIKALLAESVSEDYIKNISSNIDTATKFGISEPITIDDLCL